MKKVVILASGSGINAENIIKYFNEQVCFPTKFIIISNNPKAGVVDRAERLGVEAWTFNKKSFSGDIILDFFKSISPDLIVLAGFLWKMPASIVEAFDGKIINIHPSLLPKYGGKGMYGDHVHQAVFRGKETKTGITIHYVNQHYDQGTTILQKEVNIDPKENPEEIAKKVHHLEYEYFPKTIMSLLSQVNINIYTDGACSGNPGKGGYGIVMEWYGKNFRKEFSQGYQKTTNNRMELMAVVEALKKIKKSGQNVSVFSDSKYVVDAVEKKWIFTWEKKSFKGKKNADLWISFLKEYRRHDISFQWLRGHDGHPENERCDRLAVQACHSKDLLIDEGFETNKLLI